MNEYFLHACCKAGEGSPDSVPKGLDRVVRNKGGIFNPAGKYRISLGGDSRRLIVALHKYARHNEQQ